MSQIEPTPTTGPGTCRTCGLPILWALMDNGRRMPVDPDPIESGGWVIWWLDEDQVITDRSGQIVSTAELNVTSRRLFEERFYVCAGYRGHSSHIATCPGLTSPPEALGRRQLNLFKGGKR